MNSEILFFYSGLTCLSFFANHVSFCNQCGPRNFVIKRHSIIRTQDSIANGASVIKSLRTKTIEECESKCCESSECTAAIYEVSSKNLCYLFNCGVAAALCDFETHARYVAAVRMAVLPSAGNQPATMKTPDTAAPASAPAETKKTQAIVAAEATSQPALPSLPPPPPPPPPRPPSAPTKAPIAKQQQQQKQPLQQQQQGKPQVCRYPDLQFQCRDITKAPHCIAIYDRCDGVVHCGDGSDELDCSVASAAPLEPSKSFADARSILQAAAAAATRSNQQQKQPQMQHTGKVAEHHMLAQSVPTPLPPGARMSELPHAQGSIQLSRAPQSADDQQLPGGPDAFLKSPAASRYGFDDATDLLLRKPAGAAADDWPSSEKSVGGSQRWLPSNDRSLDYDRLGARLDPDTIYNLDNPDKSSSALDKSDAADAEFYRLGAASADRTYADRDPDSAPSVGVYDDFSAASMRRRQRLKQLAAVAAASAAAQPASRFSSSSAAAAAEPWRPRSSDIGELDLPRTNGPSKHLGAATKAPERAVTRKLPPPPPPPPVRQPQQQPQHRLTAQSQAELAELMENYRQSRTAVVALALGLGLSLVAVLFLTCRIRQLRARFRRGGKTLTSDEADYLINGMYL